MGQDSKIEWCDHTFNPWIGCTKVSAACDHCYAEALARRHGWAQWGPGEPRRRTSAANWRQPLRWNAAVKPGERRPRVFCASLADVFDAEVDTAWRLDLFQLIHATPNLDWLLLTKRPKLMAEWARVHAWPANAWAGTTVENQAMADLRIPWLMEVPAPVLFLSCEPLLGPLRFSIYPSAITRSIRKISWIIVGGESGPGARPMHPRWATYLLDYCRVADIPFFFKQWGEWAPCSGERAQSIRDSIPAFGKFPPHFRVLQDRVHCANMERVGKKAAGRLLDGRERNEFPKPHGEAAPSPLLQKQARRDCDDAP